jgi:thiosulfate dehydrogenase
MEEELRKFAAGLVVGLVLVPLSAFLYFRSSYVPVAVSDPPMPFERSVARYALHARINREMPASVPIAADESNMTAGARVYRAHCAFCHGLPDRPASPTSKGMFPKPPQLFVRMVTDDPVGSTYWKVSNGIRLTGMPGYGTSLSTDQIWQVSLMLANADKLSAATRAELNK